jgi:hypothetical protein
MLANQPALDLPKDIEFPLFRLVFKVNARNVTTKKVFDSMK